MAEQQFYDTTNGSWLTWRPLADSSSRVITRGLGEEGILQIGAFGPCGDLKAPEYVSWRKKERAVADIGRIRCGG